VSGFRDLAKAFAVFSAVYAIGEVLNRKATIGEAKARHDVTMGKLDNLARGIEALRAGNR
jgi:hypothetical protein